MLYHNDGDGTFTQVPNAGGLADATHGITEGINCSFADYDNDGWMDVAFSGNGTAEALYRNNTDGTFTDVTTAAGLSPKTNSNAIAWGDYNNDGFLDLYISRGDPGAQGPLGGTLYRNNGDGTFSDVTSAAGVTQNTNNWAAVWGDYDNDGFLDLFVARPGTTLIGIGNANILYHNNGDGTFTDQAATEGVALQDDQVTSAHKAAAWGDYNGDGWLDLSLKDGIGPTALTGLAAQGIHYLLKNNGNNAGNHYIEVKLQGIESNRDGIGARVTATYPLQIAYRQNNGGGGGEYASQGGGPLHFGIGKAEAATIAVVWPSGTTDTLEAVPAGQTITVVEGSSPLPSPSPSPSPSASPSPSPSPSGTPTSQPVNISTRLRVENGEGVMIGGFIITGTAPKRIIIRGIGPSLASSGLTDLIEDPTLQLFGTGGQISFNDDWRDSQESEIQATNIPPEDDREPAIIANP